MYTVKIEVGGNASKYWARLETVDKQGKPFVREIEQEHQGTINGNLLQAVIDALTRLNKHCMLDIYVPSDHIVAAWKNGWVKTWQESGGKNAKEKPVRNWDLWQELMKQLAGHSVRFYLNERATKKHG